MQYPYSPEEVREITLKTLVEASHANPSETAEALIKARPTELQRILDEHYETATFQAKLMGLCSATFIDAASDSAKIALWIYSSDRSDWSAVESNPKKAIREWLDQLDNEEDGTTTDASMTTVSFFKDSIRATIYTNRAEKVLKPSGKNGIFASADVCEKELREPYEVVKAPANMTIDEMMAACSEMTQGLVRIRDAMFWRVKKEHTDEFRAKMGLASGGPRTKRFEVGPIPTRVLGGSLSSALVAWGWAGARAVCSRRAGQGMTSWLVTAAAPPPARTVVVGGSTVARIRDARPSSQGRQPTAPPCARAVKPGLLGASAAPQAQSAQPVSRSKKNTDGTRTWAQVVAGSKVEGKKEPKPTTFGQKQRSAEWELEKTSAHLAKLEARVEQMEEKMERERVAREDQSAKIDAIFSFIKQSAGVAQHAPVPAARTCEPGDEPSKRPSVASGWTTLGQCKQKAEAKAGKKRERPQVKKSVLGKQFAKAVEHKRARKRGSL